MEYSVVGTLLKKIKSQSAADSADLRKTSNSAISNCGKLAENLWRTKKSNWNPQIRKSIADSKPLSHNTFHKSANPQRVSGNFEKETPNSKTIKNYQNPILERYYQSDLVHMAIQSGVFEHGYRLHEYEIIKLIPPSDFRDAAKCEPEELKAWADALALRAVRYRGKIPAGWDQVAHCAHCGPVYSFAAGDPSLPLV